MRAAKTSRFALSLFVAAAAWANAETTALGAPDKTAQACITDSEEGQRLRDENKYRSAREAFVRCADERCPVVVRNDCTRWLDDLQRMQPTLVIVGRDDAGNDVRDVRVTVDGALVTEVLDGRPLPLDPGEHEVVLEHGGLRQARRVLVISGEHERRVEGRFPSPPSTDRVPAATDGGRSFLAPAIAGGIGAVALGAAFYLWSTGVHDLGVLTADACAPSRTCPSAFDDRERAARTRILVGDVAFGAGLVAAGVATWLLLRPSPSARVAMGLGPAEVRVIGAF